jgi:methyl coenzyme M reductase gamma subunit
VRLTEVISTTTRLFAIAGSLILSTVVIFAQTRPVADARQQVVRYRLIDMGTLGGPNSTDSASPS